MEELMRISNTTRNLWQSFLKMREADKVTP
jgi:hypothetical protein